MAKEEKRDDLFNLSLGDGLIEIPDVKEPDGATSVVDDKKLTEKKKPESADGFTLHDDGMIEIDEFAKPQKNADDDESDEEDKEFIEDDDKKKQVKTPSKESSSDSSPSSSPYLAFAKDRAKEGVFLEFTDEDWQQLVERNEGDEAQALRELHEISFSTTLENQVKKYKESLTDEERALYEAKEQGLPLDKYSRAKRNYDKYSAITPDQLKENEKLQIDVVSRILEFRGYTPEEIAEEIEGYKALETLGTKAAKALELVPKAFKKEIDDMSAAATAEENAKKDKIRQRVSRMKSIIDNTAEIVPGIKINKNTKEELMQQMTVPVARDEEGNPLNAVMATRQKNPEAFEMLIHYYHKLGLFNIDDNGNAKPDFSKITKTVTTKAVDSMRTVFESKVNSNAGKSTVKKNEDEDDFDRAFARFGKT